MPSDTKPLTLLQRQFKRPPAIDELPTVRLPIVGKLHGAFAQEARPAMHTGETEDSFFLRLWLFYQHANQQESDTALVAAIGRESAGVM
jgi:hypothetical protein